MLKPRETDIPALFLFLVVFPLVAYFLLGIWSEVSKRKERLSLLAQCAAEESFRAESMTVATPIPLTPLMKIGNHECARCCAPSTTRCSRCKSVRYCSGKCQILHWRQAHKYECLQLEYNSTSSSPQSVSDENPVRERVLFDDKVDTDNRQVRDENGTGEDTIHRLASAASSETAACMKVDASDAYLIKRSLDKRGHHKLNREMLKEEDETILESSEEARRRSGTCSTSSSSNLPKKAGNKLREIDLPCSEEEIHEIMKVKMPGELSTRRSTSRSRMHEKLVNGGSSTREGSTSNNDEVLLDCSSEEILTNRSNKAKTALHSPGTKMHRLSRSKSKASIELSCPDMEIKDQSANESKVSRLRGSALAQGGNGVSSTGFMKMIGLMRSTKHERLESSEVTDDSHKRIKMLFPYEDFVKFFQCRTFNLSPRGLVNCGNSCYANAILQCLTYTKPLTIFFLRRSHSKTCCAKEWCLMCELEQHVAMLTETGGPLSPSRILSQMRCINRQIGDGSQEDAHEFLRFLITSMQSICLERLGGENRLNARLQETTFIQHTFGGRLRSKVKCLRCHHESERSESIMDLTLEIFGWVESLEDALTQFTSAEDLDGENMYRCGRCAAYVRAQKQLHIQEAPNILTIVLKRFQKHQRSYLTSIATEIFSRFLNVEASQYSIALLSIHPVIYGYLYTRWTVHRTIYFNKPVLEGNYGKINKCITFPEMLDMIPFMTGTDDIPPLYILYAVVVHLDRLNASFSGHYVTYLKDLQGSWFRIDDTEVLPVEMSQVMSEGAYILFYTRSSPRRAKGHEVSGLSKHRSSKNQKSSRPAQSKSNGHFVSYEPSTSRGPEMPNDPFNGIRRVLNRDRVPYTDNYVRPTSMEFSDTTSSDWSIFTSSDDSSFTTESTRDSFSTVDYADAGNMDPIASIFNSLYAPDYSSHKTVLCSRFNSSKPRSRFVNEENSYVFDSVNGDNHNQVNFTSPESFPYVHVEGEDTPSRTYDNRKF